MTLKRLMTNPHVQSIRIQMLDSASKTRKMKTCILITCLVLCSVSTIPVASDGGKLYLDCLFYHIEHLTDNTVFRITLPWVYL